MVGKPVGPWRAVDDDDDDSPPLPLGPYEDAPHLFRYALLYRSVARASGGTIGPDVVDGWESWQTAAYLGVGLPATDDGDVDPNAGRDPRDLVREKNEYFAALQQAQRDGTPPPEPPPSIRAVQRPVDPAAGVTVMEPLMEVDRP